MEAENQGQALESLRQKYAVNLRCPVRCDFRNGGCVINNLIEIFDGKNKIQIIGRRDQTGEKEDPDSLVRPDPDRGQNASRASPGAHHVSRQRMGNPPFSCGSPAGLSTG